MNVEPFSSFRFIESGDEYYDLIISEITKSENEIIIESYIFDFDAIGKRVLLALAEATKRNVLARVLVDGIGTYAHLAQISAFCRENGIQFRVYRALPYLTNNFRGFTRFLRTINRRNHRKVIVIDKTKAFVASFNISKVHSENLSGKDAWKDLAVFVEGPEVTTIWTLVSVFWTKYYFTVMKSVPQVGLRRIRSTHSMAARRAARNLLFQKIVNSKNHVKILTPYFVPSKKLVRALKTAAKNHGNVEIILPFRSDFLFVDLAARHVLRTLLTHKIKAYQYKPTFMHAKSVCADSWATLGSHNLNHRSLVHDLELDITLEADSELAALESYWQKIKRDSHNVSREELAKDTFFIRVLCRISFWFKNWL